MLVEFPSAGHFSFLDYQTSMQQAVCGAGSSDPAAVRAVSRAAVAAWARLPVTAALQQQGAAAQQPGGGAAGGQQGVAVKDVRGVLQELSERLQVPCVVSVL